MSSVQYCAHCDGIIITEDRFCPSCGAEIATSKRWERDSEANTSGLVNKIGGIALGAVGITIGGAFALIYITIGLGMMIGGVLFLWWLSDWGYGVGWPLGLPIRIAAISATLGLILPAISLAFMLVVGIFALLTAPFRR